MYPFAVGSIVISVTVPSRAKFRSNNTRIFTRKELTEALKHMQPILSNIGVNFPLLETICLFSARANILNDLSYFINVIALFVLCALTT